MSADGRQKTEEAFGRYRLVKVVGTGGMAEVHLARQEGPQGFVKPCVLKRISPHFVSVDRYRRMFLEEARISALLNHPSIVQTFDFGEVDGVPYMALELIEGLNLSALLRGLAKRGRWIPLRAVAETGIQVLEALSYAHTLTGLEGKLLHVVHRDVSPQNILASKQGSVKLADFGIARHDARLEVTQGVQAKGKPGYMAPEQAMGEAIDGRADLFAMGIVLTELVCARRVAKTSAVPVSITKVTERVRNLCELQSDAPQALIDLVLRLTQLDPNERPATAKEAADELRGVADSLPTRDGLANFLPTVFERYFPTDLTPTDQPATGSQFPPVRLAAGQLTPTDEAEGDKTFTDSPALPVSSEEELTLVQTQWSEEEEEKPADATGAYLGWEGLLSKKAEPQPEPKAEEQKEPALSLPEPLPDQKPKPVYALDEKKKPFSSATDTEGQSILETESFGSRMAAFHNDQVHSAPPKEGLALPKADQVAGQPAVGRGGTPDPPAVPVKFDQLFAEKKRDDRPITPYLIGIGAVGAVAALVFLGLALFSGGSEEVLFSNGNIFVSSEPAGAKIFVNGEPTTEVTPSKITNMPVETPLILSLKMSGYLANPETVKVHIDADTGMSTARFKLDKVRIMSLASKPTGAKVQIEGRDLGTTPLDLPPLRLGDTATLTVSLVGYIPSTVLVRATAEAEAEQTVELEESREIDITSEPSSAEIFIDGVSIGAAPKFAYPIPKSRRFWLKVTHPGFRPYKKRIRPKKVGKEIEIKLKPLPLLSLPMSKEERQRARELDREVVRLTRLLRRAELKAIKMQRKLDRATSGGRQTFVTGLAEAQRDFDLAQQEVDEVEQERNDAAMALDGFRHEILTRTAEGP